MKALKFVEEIIGKNKRVFEVPAYQRNYAWTQENCNQLIKDILKASESKKNHFMGTILYVNYESTSILDRCLIIDGQQRMTTLIIMLKIIRDLAVDSANESLEDEINDLLFNRHCPEEYKIKLKPVKKDERQLQIVFNGDLNEIDVTSNIYVNYINLKKAIEISEYTIEQIFEGMKLLTVVEIPLTNGEDDAQAIFESINSTGKPLTITDKLRNYLLMNPATIEEQNRLFTEHWLKIEETIPEKELERFFLDYLVLKESKLIKENNLYSEIKEFFEKNFTREEALIDLKKYANYYNVILGNQDDEISQLCKKFSQLRHNTIYPFLMKVIEDYESNLIKRDALIKTINFFINYAVRRLVTNTPSNSLRRFYVTLYDKVFSNESNKKNYFESIFTYVCIINTNDKFPSDAQFIHSLINDNIYRKSPLPKMLMDKIENNGSKEIIDFDGLTIEHIMPQNLNEQWKIDLGENFHEIHEKYLHTLGNLSVTGYNSEYSNASYEDKKQYLDKYGAKIKALNEEMLNKDIKIWDEDTIIKRAERLSNIIVKVFPFPKDIDLSIEFEEKVDYSLSELSELGFKRPSLDLKLDGYKFLDKEYQVKSYSELLISVAKQLYNHNPAILHALAKNELKFEFGKKPLLSYNKENLRKYSSDFIKATNSNIYIEVNHSTSSILSVIELLLNEYKIDPDLLTIIYTIK